MVSRRVRVNVPLGLHARVAARFVETASRFESAIEVARQGQRADGKSLLGLLRLAAPQGAEVTIVAEGPDATNAVETLARLLEHSGQDERWTG